jgi:hypothetical protein
LILCGFCIAHQTSSFPPSSHRTWRDPPAWVHSGERAPSGIDFTKATDLWGTSVAAADGKVNGTINDVTMDSSWHLALLILSNVPDRGANKVAFPFEALKRTSDGSLVLNVKGERLAIAPVFHRSYVNRMGYDQRVDRFFGLAPHWTVEHHAESDPYQWGGAAQGF